MLRAGLVQRDTDPGDRRAAVVTLTSAGRAQLAAWEEAHERRIGRALDRLPNPDRNAILAALPALARLAGLLNEPDLPGPQPAAAHPGD